MIGFSRVMRILIFVACLGQTWAQSKPACYDYEPVEVKLTGTIISRTFPGPPNYESIREGDEPETYWLLRMPKAVCVNSREPGDIYEAKTNIHRIQLVFSSEAAYKTYGRLLGKRVRATGTLYARFTGHHKTPVLLTVTSLARAE